MASAQSTLQVTGTFAGSWQSTAVHGVTCPAHTVGGPGTCIVKHDEAQKVCDATPDCEYIDVCNNKPWNDRHPDCVQLSKPPLTVNYEWLSCKPGTEPGAPASDVAMSSSAGERAVRPAGGVACARCGVLVGAHECGDSPSDRHDA